MDRRVQAAPTPRRRRAQAGAAPVQPRGRHTSHIEEESSRCVWTTRWAFAPRFDGSFVTWRMSISMFTIGIFAPLPRSMELTESRGMGSRIETLPESLPSPFEIGMWKSVRSVPGSWPLGSFHPVPVLELSPQGGSLLLYGRRDQEVRDSPSSLRCSGSPTVRPAPLRGLRYRAASPRCAEHSLDNDVLALALG